MPVSIVISKRVNETECVCVCVCVCERERERERKEREREKRERERVKERERESKRENQRSCQWDPPPHPVRIFPIVYPFCLVAASQSYMQQPSLLHLYNASCHHFLFPSRIASLLSRPLHRDVSCASFSPDCSSLSPSFSLNPFAYAEMAAFT